MAPVFLVLFLVTFLFDTRVGFFFLGAAIVTLCVRGPARRRKALLPDEAPKAQTAWKDPWSTDGVGQG